MGKVIAAMGGSGSHGVPADPYLEWAQRRGFVGFSKGAVEEGIPVLIAVRNDADRRVVLEEVKRRSAGLGDGRRKLVEPVFVTGILPVAALPRTGELEMTMSLPTAGGILAPTAGELNLEACGDELIIGVIDRGCAFLNRAFCDNASNGPPVTRIAALWQQAPDAALSADKGTHWKRVPGFEYGRALDAAGINRKLAELADSPKEADWAELSAYSDMGYLELPSEQHGPRGPSVLHGTFVMDAAGGWRDRHADGVGGGASDLASTARLVFVDVPDPASDTENTTGASADAYLFDAVRFVLDCAKKINPRARVLINLSMGANGGPHDGTALLDRALRHTLNEWNSALPEDRQARLVVSAGNANAQRLNASGILPAGERARLSWYLRPKDPTDSFLEVWCGPKGGEQAGSAARGWGQESVKVRLISPQGSVMHKGRKSGAVLRRFQGPLGGGLMFLVALAPGVSHGRNRSSFCSGVWTVEIENGSGADVAFDAWIQSDIPVVGPPVQQSFFEKVEVDGDPQECVDQGCTVNGLAMTSGVCAVFANDRAWQYTRYCSRYGKKAGLGHSKELVEHLSSKQIIAEVAIEQNPFSAGVWGSGVTSGSRVQLSGTSVCAPQVVRALANQVGAAAARDGSAGSPPGKQSGADHSALQAPLVRVKRNGTPSDRWPDAHGKTPDHGGLGRP